MACYIDPNAPLNWDALFPYVLPYVRGVPDEIMAQAIRASAIEFCRRSGYIHDTKQYDLQANVYHYPLETGCDYNIVRVFRVTVKHIWTYYPTTVKTPWNVGCYTFYLDTPTCLHIKRPPQKDELQALEVETIIAPKQDSCTLDNDLYEYWADGISAGAIARLSDIPNTSWFNPQIAKKYGDKFRYELARARGERDRAFAMSSHMMAPRWV